MEYYRCNRKVLTVSILYYSREDLSEGGDAGVIHGSRWGESGGGRE